MRREKKTLTLGTFFQSLVSVWNLDMRIEPFLVSPQNQESCNKGKGEKEGHRFFDRGLMKKQSSGEEKADFVLRRREVKVWSAIS